MLPISQEEGSINRGFFVLVIGIADEYSKVASAQLVGPFSDEDNIITLFSESAFDCPFDSCIAICPANKTAGLHQLQICLYWLQDDPDTLQVRQAATVPCSSLQSTCHHIIICCLIFILWAHNGIRK